MCIGKFVEVGVLVYTKGLWLGEYLYYIYGGTYVYVWVHTFEYYL